MTKSPPINSLERVSLREQVLFAVILVLAVGWAWCNRFIQDDAYISFVYARNWVEGHGLVFNPGAAPVEGYTNFLWTVLMAIPIRVGLDPVAFAYVIGMVCYAGTLTLTYRLARLFSNRNMTGLLAMTLLGTNYTFSAYATGGLETQLQALLVTGVMALTFANVRRGQWTPMAFVLWSLLAALAVLTRLDSLVLLLVPAWLACRALWQTRSWRAGVALAGPFAAIVGPWLAWKWSYYGALLPNTFYAKTGGMPWLRGSYYLALFFLVYLLFIPLSIELWGVWRQWRIRHLIAQQVDDTAAPLHLILLAHLPLVLWWLYIISVGGDFMEFRFFVPSLPLFMIVLAVGIRRWRMRVLMLVFLVMASMYHALTFGASPLKRGLASVPELSGYVTGPDSWCLIGKQLHHELGEMKELRVAVTGAGALPYYARLEVLDMLGLSDIYVARHGAYLSDRAGHRQIATVAYLRERGVNLIIGHPVLMQRDRLPAVYNIDDEWMRRMFVGKRMPDPEALPIGVRILEIPFDDTRVLLAVYLTANRALDAKIKRMNWRLAPVQSGLVLLRSGS